tara:strand:- start:35 stop:1570 length:1536 start_codon:yes stop_codon:yes gene_type:complete
MPLGSNKFFSKNYPLGDGNPLPSPTQFTLTTAYSGNSSVLSSGNITPDATTVTFNLDSIYANLTIGYEILGNITGSDFTNTTISGNVVTDGDGNVSIARTVSSSGGHKDFYLRLYNPEDSDITVVTSNSTNIYEVTPITASGGDVEVTLGYDHFGGLVDANKLAGTRNHIYYNGGNSNVSITSVGNYDGNANIWENQYMVGTDDSYWDSGIRYRSFVIGAGQQYGDKGVSTDYTNGGSAGVVGILAYPLANIDAGSYDIQIGNKQFQYSGGDGNSIIFKGNATLSKTATTIEHSVKYAGQDDLAESTSNVAFPNNLTQYVEWAGANEQVSGNASFVDGGAGAISTGGDRNNSYQSLYNNTFFAGLTVPKPGATWPPGQAPTDGLGRGGIGLVYGMYPDSFHNYNGQYDITGLNNVFPLRWLDNPAFGWRGFQRLSYNPGGNAEPVGFVSYAGGQSGSNYHSNYCESEAGTGAGEGACGPGGAGEQFGQDGLVTLAYPYRPAYRFVTSTDLT